LPDTLCFVMKTLCENNLVATQAATELAEEDHDMV
jgi:hypothetical protein